MMNTENAPSADTTAAPVSSPATEQGATTPQESATTVLGGNENTEKPAEGGTEEVGKPSEPVELTDFTIPEGVTADMAVVGQFKDVAQRLGLNQEQAQAIVSELAPFMAQQQAAQVEAVKEMFLNEAKADAVIGGSKFDAAVEDSRRFLNSYPHAESLKGMLNTTGTGNHAEIIKLLSWVATKVGEPTGIVTSNGGGDDTINMTGLEKLKAARR